MIFATDLDRTLIFSKRAIAEFGQSEANLIEVERTENHRSFMSKLTYQLLQELSTKILIIPITTRTIEQFNRLSLPFFKKSNSHYVTWNGAAIFTNGNRDLAWDYILKQRRFEFSDSFQLINRLLENYETQDMIEVKRFQSFYFYLKVKSQDDTQSFVPVLTEIEKMGWAIYPHRNKMYVIPPFLEKGKAIEYLQKKIGEPIKWAAGDSKMDYSFLLASEQRFVPRHGELALHLEESDSCKQTKASGIKAAEEILLSIYKQVF